MAMWWTHLGYARATLPEGPEADRFAWGALAPDVDKVWPVPRATTHAHGLARPIRAAGLLPALGADPARAPGAAAFLAGYASHLAVDSAWYRHLRHLRQARPDLAEGWSDASTRAWNLALDLEHRARFQGTVPDLSQADGSDVLPFLTGAAGLAARTAAAVYLRWQGGLDDPPPSPGFAPILERFRGALREEGARVQALLAVLDRATLDAEVLEASHAAAADVLEALAP